MIKKLIKIYTMNAIDGLGWSLVGLFVPIYFLTIGFSLAILFVNDLKIMFLVAALVYLFFIFWGKEKEKGFFRRIIDSP